QAEAGIRVGHVTGVQTCALPIFSAVAWADAGEASRAGRWWRTARQLADGSGDVEARSWVRGWEVSNGLYEQRPVPAILDRAAERSEERREGKSVGIGGGGNYLDG